MLERFAIFRELFRFLKNPPRWMFRVEKRFRFVISTLALTFFMLFSTFFFFDKAWIFIPLFVLLVYAFGFFSILEGLEEIEWIMLFLMPLIFTIAFYLFYYLFPVRWLTRLPFIALFAVSIYALLLTSNIFNVGVEKSLQLYRAAFSVNYFYQTVIAFLIFNILFSLRANFLFNSLGVGIVVFPLILQLLWSVKLNLFIERNLVFYAIFLSAILAQLALIVSFVPLRTSITALLLTAAYYSFAGLTVAHLDERLFKNTVREYVIVLAAVLIIGLLTLNW